MQVSRSRVYRFRFVRVSLRVVLIACMLVGVALVPVSIIAQEERKEAAAVANLEKCGCAIEYYTGSLLFVEIVRQIWRGARCVIGIKAVQSFSDDGMVYLKDLPYLQHLELRNTRVTDRGVACFQGTPLLVILVLDGTQVTDAGLFNIEKLNYLAVVRLIRTKVSDTGLLHLRSLKNLCRLYLNDTQVTDAGVAYLAQMKNLVMLNLMGTLVSEEGAQKLQKAIPDCIIKRSR